MFLDRDSVGRITRGVFRVEIIKVGWILMVEELNTLDTLEYS